jgi:hypothetical protein
MLKSKVLVPLIAVILVLLYVPGAPTSVAHLQHKTGKFLSDFGRGVGHLLNSASS